MSGIMRAPSKGVYFSIPYSGTPVSGDCILVASLEESKSVAEYYNGYQWSYEDDVTDFSDENNVISFLTKLVLDSGVAAFIPGPEHV